MPVALVEVLVEPRQIRAWAALVYAEATGWPVTEAELEKILVHHSGRRAGKPVGPEAAGAVVESLESLGFLLVRRQAGYQGRHEYVVLDRPLRHEKETRKAADPTSGAPTGGDDAEACSRVGEGSGSLFGEGSLANAEDSKIDRHDEDAERVVQPAVGEAGVKSREAPVDNPGCLTGDVGSGSGGLALCADGHTPPRPRSQAEAAGASRGYDGPELTFSARMAWITEPVRWLLERSRTYAQRRFARELSSQLALGIETERLRERLQRRFVAASPSEIRSPEGWLLKVAAPRWGCHDPGSEEGVLWASGKPCLEYRAVREERRRAREREAAVATGACAGCLEGGWPCAMCQLEAAASAPAERPRSADRHPPEPRMSREAAGVVEGGWRSDRCPNCRSWAPGRGLDGRCRPCGLKHAVDQAVTLAMDAAGAGLQGRPKIAAAGEAAADACAQAKRARADAVREGLSEDRVCWVVLLAAQARAEIWVRASGEDR
ncbi:hypothetical protein [Streptomyces sp. NPDC007856]|uniref:hypothetical protein n=1 Tax=Streptomyces sp. NPDC007856 TaxID=3364781 RepID=UPI0036BA208A